jgi:hypothetical protein
MARLISVPLAILAASLFAVACSGDDGDDKCDPGAGETCDGTGGTGGSGDGGTGGLGEGGTGGTGEGGTGGIGEGGTGEGGSGGSGEGGSGGSGEGGSGGTIPSLCDDNWAPCGGAPNGTYTVVETCFAYESGSEELLGLPECDSPYTYTMTIGGSMSFTATEETDDLVMTEELVTVIGAACLDAMEELFEEVIDYTCADYASDWDCTEFDVVGTDCVCTQTETWTADGVLLYAVEGNNLTYRDSGED